MRQSKIKAFSSRLLSFSDGSGSRIFGSIFFARVGLVRFSHLWFGFGKFPPKIPNFSIFFPSGQKGHFRSGQKVPGSKTV